MTEKTDQAGNCETNALLHQIIDEQIFRVDEIGGAIDDLIEQLRDLRAELEAMRASERSKRPSR